MFFRKEKDISTPKFSLCNADMSLHIHIDQQVDHSANLACNFLVSSSYPGRPSNANMLRL